MCRSFKHTRKGLSSLYFKAVHSRAFWTKKQQQIKCPPFPHQIYATEKTAECLKQHYIKARNVSWPLTEDSHTEHPKATKWVPVNILYTR